MLSVDLTFFSSLVHQAMFCLSVRQIMPTQFMWPYTQLLTKCADGQPISQSVCQPISQADSQSFSQSVSQPISHSDSQSISQSVSQTISQTGSRSIRYIREGVSKRDNQSVLFNLG